MTKMKIDRREFLKGCCATAAVGAAGPTLLFSEDAQAAANAYDTVVVVFLRGGIDGLNLVPPISGNDRTFYEEARPSLNIAATGTYGALPLTLANGTQTGFGLHPSATGLRDIWDAGKLAIVHSCGLANVVTRSHFDAQLYLDLGTPGSQNSGTGWLTRAWQAQNGGNPTMPLLAVANRQPTNLLGSTQSLAMPSPSDFALNAGAWQWQQFRSGMPAGTRGVNESLATLWNGLTGAEVAGRRADSALQMVATQPYTSTLPANWPTTTFARQLWTVAQSIRFDLGLRYATLDLGGWDTHDGQGTAGSGYNYYQNKIAELSQALTAFYNELNATGEMSRVTVIVQSEFGRRVRQNGSGGTDHGYGNPLLVLGGPVNGRRLYGQWLGLAPETLSPYFGDIPVTTDYRRVFSEMLIRRLGNNKLGSIFPGYTGYSPLGIFQGSDIAPQYAQIDLTRQTASLPVERQPAFGESLQQLMRTPPQTRSERHQWVDRLRRIMGM
jgi:uncharacterized protein (DUF1501 family)